MHWLPWQSARRRVEAGSLLIPQPDNDQLLLEAGVIARLRMPTNSIG
ncbi:MULTISPECIES: hypothetical protein [unclassified Streptomyces]